jgi:pilus assembly protein Flp/PilA
MGGFLKRFWHEESGQGLTEYALILALVAIGLIAVLIVFRDAIGGIFDRIAETLQGAPADSYTPGGGGGG